jgi:predicted nucleic acid-binding protein
MNVVDTSGWLEYFSGGENAQKFCAPIMQFEQLVVPTVCIYEISKIILRESSENDLLQVLSAIQKGRIISLDPSIATAAAKVGLKYKLPMADSIIYATANQFDAIVWTQDADFKDLPNVNYIPKQ